MNSNPYTLPAFITVAAVLFGCLAWLYLSVTQPSGQHARRRTPAGEGERFGAYLRGEDPGEQPAPQITVTADALHDEPGEIDYDNSHDHPGWWDDDPPQPPAVEILTGPGTRIRQTSEVTTGVLARVRDALLPDAWKPEPAAATFTPADPDVTLTDLRPADAPKYLAAPQ